MTGAGDGAVDAGEVALAGVHHRQDLREGDERLADHAHVHLRQPGQHFPWQRGQDAAA